MKKRVKGYELSDALHGYAIHQCKRLLEEGNQERGEWQRVQENYKKKRRKREKKKRSGNRSKAAEA